MESSISATFTVFMIKETLLWIIGYTSVKTVVITEENINTPHNVQMVLRVATLPQDTSPRFYSSILSMKKLAYSGLNGLH